MALGKEAGSWTYKVTSTRYTPGPGSGQTVEVDMGGPVTGEMPGTGQGTLTAVSKPGAKTGTWSWCGALYLNDGGIVETTGKGTIEESGKHKWRLHGFAQASDGRSWAVEMAADFATQTVTGKAFEWS